MSTLFAPQDDHPFARRIDFDFEFPDDAEWLNTSGRVRLRDLRGKFVLIDFWTYCCINCIHIMPELEKLEQKYPNQLVVIGVHSAKFETEKDTQNILDAILRYEIKHPVVNDPEQAIWNRIGVNAWPTLILIDPAGQAVWYKSGETKAEVIDQLIAGSIDYYRGKDQLDESPVRFELHQYSAESTPLRFPGKVLADGGKERLFISDSNHNRIVITKLDGTLIDIIGSGKIGAEDGDYASASFDHPQGMTLKGETLYVADTENHLIRKVNLLTRQVTTIAGTGKQAQSGFPGLENLGPVANLPARWTGPTRTTAIASPWDLWIHNDDLFIAMAGPHQIWKMPLDESEIYPFAGNGREDIVDGPLLPKQPYAAGFSSFAQPSGLSADDRWLYVADSEGSSVRRVPLNGRGEVETLVGTAGLRNARLFTFGDVDGPKRVARFQHCLGVAYHEGVIYVADTYNNKIRVIDARTGDVSTFVGDGTPGRDDSPARFDEPAGISYALGKLYVADTNNHLIRVIDIATREVSTLQIPGLEPPARPAPTRPTFADATPVDVAAADVAPANNMVSVEVDLRFPPGWKINPLAPLRVYLAAGAEPGVVDAARIPQEAQPIEPPSDTFQVQVPVTGEGAGLAEIAFEYYSCQDGGEGLCKVGSTVLRVPITVSASGAATAQVVLPIQP